VARASLGLFAFVTFGSMFAVGCGRGGLGDFDPTGAPIDDAADTGVLVDTGVSDTFVFDSGEFDTDFTDTDIFVDVPPVEDTDLPPFDGGEIDTDLPPFDTDVPPFDTGVPDTDIPPFDTGVVDTDVPPFDTGVLDTDIPPTDTSVLDTDIPPFDTGVDTGVTDTGIPPFDTGVDTGFDAPPEGGILCGGAYCSAATQECCASPSGFGCVAKGKCGGTTLACSSAASCPLPGQTCCLGGLLGGTPSVSCQFFCAGFRLCASNAECAKGQTCQAAFGGYRICR